MMTAAQTSGERSSFLRSIWRSAAVRPPPSLRNQSNGMTDERRGTAIDPDFRPPADESDRSLEHGLPWQRTSVERTAQQIGSPLSGFEAQISPRGRPPVPISAGRAQAVRR